MIAEGVERDGRSKIKISGAWRGFKPRSQFYKFVRPKERKVDFIVSYRKFSGKNSG